MGEQPRFGATGQFPHGAINEDDQGELAAGVAADAANQRVIVQFGKRIAWLAMTPGEARAFAAVLVEKANKLDGGVP